MSVHMAKMRTEFGSRIRLARLDVLLAVARKAATGKTADYIPAVQYGLLGRERHQ
jgi:hypothetical protein